MNTKWSTMMAVVLASTGAAACGSSASGTNAEALVSPFSATVTSIDIEVDYATGAVPYTGSVTRLSDVWQVTADNLERVFQGAPKTITVPRQLAQMQELGDVSGTSFTADALLAIASKHRDHATTATTVSYYVSERAARNVASFLHSLRPAPAVSPR